MHVLGDWSLRYDVLSWGGGPAARVCWPASTQPHFFPPSHITILYCRPGALTRRPGGFPFGHTFVL